jgi:hypothetical protein|tara:strand:+ start:7819 stop:8385 length:567 start_codon:yes stop_codon:yes gene_type:complete
VKAILFFSVLFFSASANSALFTILTGGAASPFGGHYDGCSSECVIGYKDPAVFPDAVDLDNPINNENYFSVGTDLVDRQMTNGANILIERPVNIVIEWTTFNITDASLYYDGKSLALPGTGSGLFSYYLFNQVYTPFTSSFAIGGKALSLESFVELRFYEVSEVPLPATLFLLAPALFGFMGLRRKLS